jgi:hypothetical protein
MLTTEDKAKAAATLKETLRQFTGSEQFYRAGIPSLIITEGVKHLADTAGAYWLIDLIASWQVDPSVREQEFQVWKLVVEEDESAVVTCEDGNDDEISSQKIQWTDFPLREITLWFTGGTLLLPSEY